MARLAKTGERPTTGTSGDDALAARDARVRKAQTRYSPSITAILAKVVLLGLLDAAAIYGALVLARHHNWLVMGLLLLATLIINAIYIPPNRFLPGKYLTPGLVFLLIFQLFVIVYTIYVGFTNAGDGHMISKPDAVAAIQRNTQDRLEDSPEYTAAILKKPDNTLAMAVVEPGKTNVRVGDNGSPLKDAPDAKVADEKIASVPGYEVLGFADVIARSKDIEKLAVPMSDDPAAGTLRTQDGDRAYVYVPRYAYDKAQDTFTTHDGKVYRDGGQGSYVSDSGERIEPGWQVNVGWKNFERAFTDSSIRGPLWKVTVWTFAQAILSVLLCFAVGLFFAMMFNDKRVRFRRVYRTLMILPYAVPGFLGILIWSGLMNPSYGFINQTLLGGHIVHWLDDPWIAKISVLIVNTWLGYPYMFLVSTGALQSIPEEVTEAARMDGASPWKTFWNIKLPLLMVSLAPLLISSFAFNFNNFLLIFMLTGGGPRFSNTGLDAGATDILISLVYKVAMGDRGRDLGLASAFSIIIFVVIGVISAIAFRRTRSLEDVN